MNIPVEVSGRSEDDVRNEVMERVFNGSGLSSIQRAESTHWGSPKNWYVADARFIHQFATVDVDEWLSLHDSIEHGREGAYSGTVERVVESIEAGNEAEIPTPPLEMKPSSFSDDPMVYEPVREGRSRAVGAKKAGVNTIPILVAVWRPRR